jgi:hypothetical protein
VVTDIFQSTAKIVNIYNSSLFATAAQQGAGLVDAYQALTSTTLILPSELSLNDTLRKATSYTVNVTNMGDQPGVYTISHGGAALATGKTADDDQLLSTPLYSADYAVSFVLEIYILFKDFLKERDNVSFSKLDSLLKLLSLSNSILVSISV